MYLYHNICLIQLYNVIQYYYMISYVQDVDQSRLDKGVVYLGEVNHQPSRLRFDDEDGPDHFFRRQQPKASNAICRTDYGVDLPATEVRPAWNRYTSPSKVPEIATLVRMIQNLLQVRMSNSVTFFFPNKELFQNVQLNVQTCGNL